MMGKAAALNAVEMAGEPAGRPSGSAKDRKRAAFLSRRQRSLEQDVEEAQLREGQLVGRLEELDSGLAEGTAKPVAVRAGIKALAEGRADKVAAESALFRIKGELVDVSRRVAAVEEEQEKRRQDRLAEPLRQEAADLLAAVAAGAGSFRKALEEHQELCSRITREYPLAWPMTATEWRPFWHSVCEVRGWRQTSATEALVKAWLIGAVDPGRARSALRELGFDVR